VCGEFKKRINASYYAFMWRSISALFVLFTCYQRHMLHYLVSRALVN
jgi:hypothetical protein